MIGSGTVGRHKLYPPNCHVDLWFSGVRPRRPQPYCGFGRIVPYFPWGQQALGYQIFDKGYTHIHLLAFKVHWACISLILKQRTEKSLRFMDQFVIFGGKINPLPLAGQTITSQSSLCSCNSLCKNHGKSGATWCKCFSSHEPSSPSSSDSTPLNGSKI